MVILHTHAPLVEMLISSVKVPCIEIKLISIFIILLVNGTVVASNCTSGDVRVNGINNNEAVRGRVEVCLNKVWTTVCGSSGWDIQGARVVCNQLGNEYSQSYIIMRII